MNPPTWEWLDRIETVGPETLVAAASFPPHRFAVEDHFPGCPLVPGVLLTEAMAQAAGWWVAWREGFMGKCLLARLDEVVFRLPVVPGEAIRVEVGELVVDGARRGVHGGLWRDGVLVASARVGLRFFRFEEPGSPWRMPLNQEWLRERFARLRG